jgi:hypothetical protein
LYSLDEALIDALLAEVPAFFRADQERFERDLARTASFGFFCRRPLGSSQHDTATASLEERNARSDRAIRELLAEEYRRAGASDDDVRVASAAREDRRDLIAARKQAFTGWLVTCRQFRDELRNLQTKWEAQVDKLGRFPSFPHWPLHDLGLQAEAPDAFVSDFLGFYSRWNLQQLLTWDWPIPMEPDLVGGMLKNEGLLAETGIRVFLPWYLLRGEKLNVQDLIRHGRALTLPPHLREWVQKTRKKQNELGDVRYERLAYLYRFLDLALRRRYPEACRRKAQKAHPERACLVLENVDMLTTLEVRANTPQGRNEHVHELTVSRLGPRRLPAPVHPVPRWSGVLLDCTTA